MRCKQELALLTLLVYSVVAPAQSLPAGVKKVTSVEGITEYQLANGLHVLLFPDATHPKVTVNMTYMVGSRQEGYGETGMAHLLEHILFLKTKTRENVKKELTDHGAEFNGSTSWDRTNYFETMTATDENLKYGIELEADRMVNSRVEKQLLDTEMTVVRNEFEQQENSPEGVLFQRVMKASYSWHNYGKPPIGNRSDIENVPINRLAAFYQKYYQPDNALLTIAGKFDEAQALKLVANAFDKIPKPTRTLEATYTIEPAQDGERDVTLRRVGDIQSVMAMYHVPSGSHPDAPAIDILAGVLGDTPSGRLYKALVDNKKAVNANMGMQSMHDPGFMVATARLQADQNLEEASQIMLKTIENLVKEPPTKEEVERVKTRMLKDIELEMADSQSIAVDLSEFAAEGDWRLLFLNRDRLKAVTPEDVLRVAKLYIKESNRTLGKFIPTKQPDRAEIPETLNLSEALKDYKGGATISQGETFEPTPANIAARTVTGTLTGGVKYALLPKKTRGGTVVASLTIRFGDEKSLFGKDTIGALTGNLLMHGTRHHTRQQIQDEMDKLKAQMNVTGGATSATAMVETTEENLPAALRLAVEILREPSFPDNEFETVRTQRIAGTEAGKSDPQALAVNELRRHLNPYKRGDIRYVSTPDEAVEDLKKVTLDDIKKFHQGFYGASVGEFTVSGQFDAQAIKKLGDELLGDWKSPGPKYARILSPFEKITPLDKKIETPDKQNAFFITGAPVKITDEDPDFPAIMIGNYILGGSGTGSKLFARIRDKEGLSYGVNSIFSAPVKDDGGSFMTYAISAPQNTPKVESSFRDELTKNLKEGYTAAEVDAAKKAWAQERIVARSQDGSIVGLLAARIRFDRTMDWDKALEAKVAALTPEQIAAAMRKFIDPTQLSFVKAGDFKKAGVLQP
jgi:zinc protease